MVIKNESLKWAPKTSKFCVLARFSLALILMAVLIGFGGCAGNVKPKPFEEYSESFQKMRTGADALMELDYQLARQGFVDQALRNAMKVDDVSLTIDAKWPHKWQYNNEPLFVKVRKAQKALEHLNSQFAKYTGLLIQISGGEIVDQKRFDKLAADLNKNSKSAVQALSQAGGGKISLAASEQGLALFSAAAATAAKAYIDNKRKEELQKTITENQPVVDLFSKLAKQLIVITGKNLKKEYASRQAVIASKFASATKQADKEKWVVALIDFNNQITDGLDALKALNKSYGLLPESHKALGESIDKDFIATTIRELNDSGKNLNRLYRDLRK